MKTILEIAATAEEYAKLKEDAERYQWLRANLDKPENENFPLMEHKKGCDYGVKQFSALDEAIDQAIKESK